MEKSWFKSKKKAALVVVSIFAITSASFLTFYAEELQTFGQAFEENTLATNHQWWTVGQPVGTLQPDYQKIQDAIDNVGLIGWWGIVVLETYNPNIAGEVFPIEVHRPSLVVTSFPLTIMAKGAVVLDGGGEEFVFHVTSRRVTIEGFTIKNAGSWAGWPGAGIFLDNVRDCKIRNNTVYGNPDSHGIYLNHSDRNLIEANVVKNSAFIGISLYHSHRNTIKLNEVRENGRGISLEGSERNFIEENIMELNIYQSIELRGSHRNDIIGNIGKTGGGIYITGSRRNDVIANTVRGIHVESSNETVIDENMIVGTSQDLAGGIACVGSAKVPCFDNKITRNVVDYALTGIFLIRCDDTEVRENSVVYSYLYGNIVLWNSNDTVVVDNQASLAFGHPYVCGIYLWDNSDDNTIDGNVVVDNALSGIRSWGGGAPSLDPTHAPSGNQIINNIAICHKPEDGLPFIYWGYDLDDWSNEVTTDNYWNNNYFYTQSPLGLDTPHTTQPC